MKNNQEKVKTVFEFILMIAATLGSLYLLKSLDIFAVEKPESLSDKIIMWIGIFLMMFITLGIHELGHLLAGLAQGFQFQLYVVGLLGIKREDDKIKVYLNKNMGLFGGVAATTPVRDDPDNPQKFARLILAGPLTSLVFAVIGLGLSTVLPTPYSIIFFAGGGISLAVFFATTIPSKTGMFFTDRKRYQRLITPGPNQEVEMAMLRIMGRYAQDNSYTNVAVSDMETLIEDEMPFLKFYGYYNMLCYQMEMDGETKQDTEEQYRLSAEELPKAMVEAMDKELEKMRVAKTKNT